MSARSEMLLLSAALERALLITGQELGNIQLIDWNAGHMEIATQQGFKDEFLESFHRVTMRDGCACGRALLARKSIVIDDVAADRQFAPYLGIATRAGFRAVQSTPLATFNGALLGMISTHGRYSPTPLQLEQIKTLALETANELVRCRSIEEAERSAGLLSA